MRIERFIVGPLLTNCYVLVSDGEAAVIDPGELSPELAGALAGTTLKYVLLTHGHFDHAGAAAEVRRRFGGELLYHRAEREVFFAFGNAPPEADGYLEDGQEIRLGDETLSVRHLPGHSPGSVVFLWERGEVAFCGDLLFAGAVGRWDLPGGSFVELQESLRKFISLLSPGWKIYPGHGEPTDLAAERTRNPFLRDLQ
ncbi:MAG: MBL fold metallo-hydrolase [Caldiserica bacterium]|nr:MBL fold metallo-hydrolase [Caldisericota bacterium]